MTLTSEQLRQRLEGLDVHAPALQRVRLRVLVLEAIAALEKTEAELARRETPAQTAGGPT